MTQHALHWIDAELADWEARFLRRRLAVRELPQTAETMIDGRRLVNFGANDYLGLAADPRLAEAARNAIDRCGWGAGASPLVSGRGSLHAELEARLAEFEGTEAALLFPSGFAANAGTIAALAGKEDAIYSDAKNHASMIDGCRLSGAKVFVYPHNDTDALADMLSQASEFRRRLIATDSLFSMDGDFAPLGALSLLAERFDCMLLADEAHATGAIGEHGRGVTELLSAESGVSIRVGTLSKAFGSHGGFVAGTRKLIDYLANRARSYVFSTAAPEAVAATGLAALEIVATEPERRSELQRKAEFLRERLWRNGWWLGGTQSHIVPIVVGDAVEALRLSAALRDEGFFVPAIRPPSVPEGESLLRVSVSYAHSEEHLDRLADALLRCAAGGAE